MLDELKAAVIIDNEGNVVLNDPNKGKSYGGLFISLKESVGDISREDILSYADAQQTYKKLPDPDGDSKDIDKFQKNVKLYRKRKYT